ncbi:ABC transporter permease subunit [Desulfosarcina cetonica]|uniref:ABC transporter permease subunit n=1 Tax=Desulfosarcina cetonica TaxID=90730 RepID=UPI00155DC1A8|nr:ABC transporter permease subunit [Desulfosarcina cetonica]
MGCRQLGASPWQRMRRVFFPLTLPGVAVGFLLTFIVGAGTFVTPTLMGGPKDTVVAMSIESQMEIVNDWGFAATLGVILLVTVLLLFSLCLRFMGLESLFGTNNKPVVTHVKKRRGMIGKLGETMAGGVAARWSEHAENILQRWLQGSHQAWGAFSSFLPRFLCHIPWGGWSLKGFCALVAFYLIFPLGIILPIAFSNDSVLRFPPESMGLGLLGAYFSSGAWMRATLNSLRVAAPVSLLATTLGTRRHGHHPSSRKCPSGGLRDVH